jgi:putative phosphoribosyl transferase
VQNRTAIVVDDGIATGGSMRAALRMVRRSAPSRLVMAVPVAPPETLAELAPDADDVVCLVTPPDFVAVGRYYWDFRQTTDDEVVALLAERP